MMGNDDYYGHRAPGSDPYLDTNGLDVYAASAASELATDTDVAGITHQMQGLLNDSSIEFYANLLRAKAANARNLGLLDTMYQQRWRDAHAVSGYSHAPTYPGFNATAASAGASGTNALRRVPTEQQRFETAWPAAAARSAVGERSAGKGFGTSPPPGRARMQFAEEAEAETNASSPPYGNFVGRRALEVQIVDAESEEESYDSNNDRTPTEEFWRGFMVEEYAPERPPPRVIPPSPIRPKPVTVPKPFSFEARDKKAKHSTAAAASAASQSAPSSPPPSSSTTSFAAHSPTPPTAGTNGAQLYQDELKARAMDEAAEMAQQFRASPMPASVREPRFAEMMIREEKRKSESGKIRAEQLAAKVRPPAFLQREAEKRRDFETRIEAQRLERQKPAPTFRARPVPKWSSSGDAYEKNMEQEAYRRIRVKIRAEKMVKSASAPPSEARRIKERQRREEDMEIMGEEVIPHKTPEHTFHPEITHMVPDFEALHAQHEHKMARAKAKARRKNARATRQRPFSMMAREANKPDIKERIRADMEADAERRNPRTQKHPLGPQAKAYVALARAASARTPRSTTAAEVRAKHVQDQLNARERSGLLAEETQRQRHDKQASLSRQLSERAGANDNRRALAAERRLRVRQRTQEDKLRQQAYDRALDQMYTRIESRPFLFQRSPQELREGMRRRISQPVVPLGNYKWPDLPSAERISIHLESAAELSGDEAAIISRGREGGGGGGRDGGAAAVMYDDSVPWSSEEEY